MKTTEEIIKEAFSFSYNYMLLIPSLKYRDIKNKKWYSEEEYNIKKGRTSCKITVIRNRIKHNKILTYLLRYGEMTTKEIFLKKPISKISYKTYQRHLDKMLEEGMINKKNIIDKEGNRNYWSVKR